MGSGVVLRRVVRLVPRRRSARGGHGWTRDWDAETIDEKETMLFLPLGFST